MGRRRKRAVFPPSLPGLFFLPPSLGCFPPSLPGLFFLPPSLGCFSSLPPLFDFAFLKKGGGGK